MPGSVGTRTPAVNGADGLSAPSPLALSAHATPGLANGRLSVTSIPPLNSAGSSTENFLASTQRMPLRRGSTSFSQLSDFKLDPDTVDEPEGNGVDGLRHVNLSIDASEWRHPNFKVRVLSMLRKLKVPYWTSPLLKPSSIHLQKISGALTNAVFFVSFNPRPEPTSPSMSPLLTPTMPPSDPDHAPPLTPDLFPPTVLMRIYGPSSDVLISRTEELRILHALCTVYGLGPRLFGTFENGRIEQFFPSRALTADELRQPLVSRGIARRMRELHSVDLKVLGYPEGKDTVASVWGCLEKWVELAREPLNDLASLGGKWEVWVNSFGLHRIKEEIDIYRKWMLDCETKGRGVVFCHNDTQYGNLLLLDRDLPAHAPPHQSYIVIDFEYGAPNPRGYDIANHFHEWRANYHHPTHPHRMTNCAYPDAAQREDFYRAYLSIELDSSGEEIVGKRKDVSTDRISRLAEEVRVWSPSCSVFWALWGIVQGEEQVRLVLEGQMDGWEFDYLAYANERIEMFRDEAREIGVPLPLPLPLR